MSAHQPIGNLTSPSAIAIAQCRATSYGSSNLDGSQEEFGLESRIVDDRSAELQSGHLGSEAENVEERQECEGVEVIVFAPRQVLHTRMLVVKVGVGYHGLMRMNHTFRQSGGT